MCKGSRKIHGASIRLPVNREENQLKNFLARSPEKLFCATMFGIPVEPFQILLHTT